MAHITLWNECGKITLLIIDDNQADGKLYDAWLKKQPDKQYNIIEAGSAREGYEAFIKYTPACIILDFMMYGKNGFQLLIEMKQEPAELPPIIFVTAMHSDVVEKDTKALGVHAYIDKKNLTKEVLYSAVNKALAQLLKEVR